jgi:chemotaxis signal transduction protein
MRLTTVKLLIFPVGNLWLSLALEGVKKVIPRPEIIKGRQPYLGLCYFENQEVTVIDLSQKILGQEFRSDKSYLIVVQSPKGLYGITVTKLPLMRDVPSNQLHSVPAEYRERDTLNIASHMLQVSLQPNQAETVFLLDEKRLIELI